MTRPKQLSGVELAQLFHDHMEQAFETPCIRAAEHDPVACLQTIAVVGLAAIEILDVKGCWSKQDAEDALRGAQTMAAWQIARTRYALAKEAAVKVVEGIGTYKGYDDDGS